MSKLFVFLILIVSALTGEQDEKFTFIRALKIQADQFITDPSGNMYAVQGDLLEKYSAEGKKLGSYSNKVFGQIASVDLAGSLRIMVLYTDPARVVILDNNLSPVGDPVQLGESGYPEVRAACLSADKGFWIYDPSRDAFILLSVTDRQVLAESGSVSQLTGEETDAVRILEYANQLFLLQKSGKIRSFDRYGAYLKLFPVSGVRSFQVREDRLFYLDSMQQSLNWIHLKTLENGNYALPDDSVISFRYDDQKLFLMMPGKLSVYAVSR